MVIRKKKLTCFVLAVLLSMVLFSGCADNTSSIVSETTNETEDVEATNLPLTFENFDVFAEAVIKEKGEHKDSKEASTYAIEELDHYYEMHDLSDEFPLKEIMVGENGNYVMNVYKAGDNEISLFWFRGIKDPSYDFVSDTRALFNGYQQEDFEMGETMILSTYHSQNENCPIAYYQYTFVYNGDNLEVSVPADLIQQYGREMFLQIGVNQIG